MPVKFSPVNYKTLNSKQKENFNFQKLSAVLADYGFSTVRLSDDWCGADFIAVHKDGTVLKVQLKGRLHFMKEYRGKDLYIAFPSKGEWYLVPHDEALEKVFAATKMENTPSWKDGDGYSYPGLSKKILPLISQYKIVGDTNPIPTEENDPPRLGSVK